MRKLSAEGLAFLSSNDSIKIFHLVRLETSGSTEASPEYHYMSDAPMPFTFDSNQYAPNRVTSVGTLTMTTGMQSHKLSITVAGEYQEELNRALIGPSSNESYLNKEIVVNRIYVDALGNTVNMDDNNNGAFFFFKGLITNINVKEDVKSGSSTVTWSCANHFEDFNLINGRLTDDYVHRGLVSVGGVLQPSDGAKSLEHKTDKGFYHSNTAVDVVAQYTSKETRYKTKSSWGGFKTKTTSYEAEVINDLDLKFNLAAKYIPTIYGIRQTSGIPVFIDVDKLNTNKVYVVFAVCEGEIDGFLDMYIDGIPVVCSVGGFEVDSMCIGSQQAGNTLGIAPNSNVGNNDPAEHGRTLEIDTNNTTAKFTFYNGTPDQLADPTLVALAAADRFMLQNGDVNYWDSTYRLLDTAYVVMEYTITEDAGSIPEIDFVVQGKNVDVYDVTSSSINKYSLNPVWHLLDYMISNMYGGSLKTSDMDLSSFYIAAAELDKIDTTYEMGWLKYSRYIGWPNTGEERRQQVQCNTVLPGSASIFENIKTVLDQFDGSLNLVNGKYALTLAKDDTFIAANIDISDVKGGISTKEQSNKNTWNTIQANIQDPAIGWASNKITFFNNVYKQEDRNIEKKGTLSFKHITNYYTARSRAEVALNRSRFSREFTFTVWHKFSHLTPNDIITLTYPRFFGVESKKLMVTKVVANKGGTFTISAEDYDNSIYQVADQGDNGANEGTVQPGVRMPLDIHMDSYEGTDVGVNGILNWAQVPQAGISHYMVTYESNRLSVLPTSTQVIVVGGSQVRGPEPRPYVEISGLTPSTNYTFQIKTVLLSGRASSWTEFTYMAGLIDSNLPPVENFRVINLEPGTESAFFGGSVQLAWDGIIDPNVTGYDLEFLLGNQDEAEDAARTVVGSADITKSITVPTQINYEYTLAANILDYAANNTQAVGVYRDIAFRVRAKNPNGGVSNYWSYIN